MDKKEVIKFFDERSEIWDTKMIKDDNKMNEILDTAKVCENKSILDIACGTGVMIDYYIERKVSNIVGVDISPNMINIAKDKFKNYDNISFICCDAENYNFAKQFDCAIIFNAFPHFVSPIDLLNNLYKAVKIGGTLTVAHDRGRKEIDLHHKEVNASKISNGLMSADELEKIFIKAGFKNTYIKSTDDIYIVTGTKA